MRSAEWEATPGFFLYLAILLFVLPLPWVLAALTAGMIHELGHLIALKSMKISVMTVRLEAAGVRLLTAPCSDGQELVCAAAGPASGLLMGLLFPFFPRFAFCAMAQTLFNLLPLLPFDGGRVLRSGASVLLGQSRGGRLYRILERVICVGLFLGGIFLLRFSILLAIVCASILLSCIKKRKNHILPINWGG